MSKNRFATFVKISLTILSFVIVLFLAKGNTVVSPEKTEILWDTWGVPHVYGKDDASLFEAFGWAQTQSHGNLLLRLYGQARGKAAEYWGEQYLSSDEYVITMGIPARAQVWYQASDEAMKTNLDAFAAGINSYIQANPQEIDEQVKAVLPITGVDILAHVQRVIYFHFLVNPQQVASLGKGNNQHQNGSNAWAIAPHHSASGNAMLLANPHLPWGDLFLWYEAQLTAPGIDVYGATLVGMPTLAIAFNDHLGWTFTINPLDGFDIYELTLTEGGYLLDGKVKAFETETTTVKIGKSITKQLSVKKSIQGTVIAENQDKALALRVVGLDNANILQQFWQMGKAKNLNQFEDALKSLQLPMFNIIYADQQGQIFYLFNGQIPIKSQGDWDYWQGLIPGNTQNTLWTKYHTYQDLPKLVNPKTGWLQNANDPPWTSTHPPLLKAENYPSYFAPPSLGKTNNILRPQRSLQMLLDSPKISFDEMIEKKFSSHLVLADRLLDDLIAAAKLLANPLGLEAANILAKWDRQTSANSKGAVLFTLWALSLEPNGLFAQPWDEKSPLNTPTGLANYNLALGVLEGVAAQVKLLYGAIDVSWGQVVRMRYGKKDVEASGGMGKFGSFRVLDISQTHDEKFQVIAGDSYIAAIEFSNPVKAKVLTVYGNASQPNSSHVGDQLELYSRSELRPVWRDRQEIEAHLESSTIMNKNHS